MTTICLVFIALLGVRVQAEIPASSFDKLGGIFGLVRDHLWDANEEYWHQGDFERCIATMRLIAEIDPHDTEAFCSASWLMWNQGRGDEAEAFLKKGLELNHDEDTMYFEVGHYYYSQERFEEAIAYLETAVTFPTHWRTWHVLAHNYEHAGDKSEALNIWLLMEARDPSFAVPQMQIDRILTGGPPPSVRAKNREPSPANP